LSAHRSRPGLPCGPI